jgi:hypothetical protein
MFSPRLETSSSLRAVIGFVVGVAVGVGPAAAQCGSSWQSLSVLPGASNAVRCLAMWDRDGAGPLSPVLVVGGMLEVAGAVRVGRLATYDPANGQWSALGGGVSTQFLGATQVNAIAPLPNGDLAVAGTFLTAGNVPAPCIARWDGSSWHPYGNGIGGAVHALAVLPNGDLVAGGNFFLADGNVVGNVARWNGTTWVSLGLGLDDVVYSLLALPSGELLAGGAFTTAGGAPVPHLARWNGSVWSPFAGGMTGDVYALARAANGDVLVGGDFVGAAGVGANGLARWNGTAWSAFGSGTTGVRALALAPNGDLLAGGSFEVVDGVPALRLARWNGSAWAPVGAGMEFGTTFALVHLPDGSLCVGGNLRNFTGELTGIDHLLRFDGTAFGPLQRGTSGAVNASLRLRNGDLVVGGAFRQLATIAANGVARRVGATWSALGAGVDGTVHCVLELANGDLLVGGLFTTAGGVAAANVARWDGSSWSPMGAGLPAAVNRLVQRPNGQIVAGGAFGERIAVWNGTAWIGTGVAGSLAAQLPVRALAVLPNGDVAASAFQILGTDHHAVWNGASWTALPPLSALAADYEVAQNGDLLAVLSNSPAAARRLSGSTWLQIGGNLSVTPSCIHELPNGELLLGGSSSGEPSLHRFDGSTWNLVVAAAQSPQSLPIGWPAGGSVRSITAEVDGSLFLGGDFRLLDGKVASRMARMTSNCPAGVLVAGGGCSGSGGVNTLAATSLPWLGSTFHSVASGLAPSSIAVHVLGAGTASVPLPTLLPQASAGCVLQASPDALAVVPTNAGTAAIALPLPNLSGLLGLVLRQQVVALELDPFANVVGASAGNVLVLTLGAF